MINENIVNDCDGNLYSKNQSSDISIKGIKKEKDNTANVIHNLFF